MVGAEVLKPVVALAVLSLGQERPQDSLRRLLNAASSGLEVSAAMHWWESPQRQG